MNEDHDTRSWAQSSPKPATTPPAAERGMSRVQQDETPRRTDQSPGQSGSTHPMPAASRGAHRSG